jgi:DNA polymerase-1
LFKLFNVLFFPYNINMKANKEKLVVIDGNAVIYRSFYAVQSGLSYNGQATNAVYGFFSILFKVINELQPQYLLVALDRPEPTFRHRLSADYKAQRAKQPDELYSQIPIIKQLLKTMAVPVLELAGYEADDIIGTVVNKVPQGVQAYIVTGDKDSFQLVNNQTSVYWLKQGLQKTVILDQDGVKQVLGLEPRQVVDYKALRGDPSDNIPGVPGIGDKTALDLLKTFDTLDKLQETLADDLVDERIKPRWRQLIKDNQASLDLSQRLATIDRDVPLDFVWPVVKFGDFDIIAARQAFLDWQLRSLIPRLEKLADQPNKSVAQQPATAKLPVIAVKSIDESARLAAEYSGKTISLLPLWEGERLTKLILSGSNRLLEFTVAGPAQQGLFQGDVAELADTIKPWQQIFENKQIKKIIFQSKEVGKFLAKSAIKLAGLAGDPLLANYLLNPGARQDSLIDIGQQVGFSLEPAADSLKMADSYYQNCGQLEAIHQKLVEQLRANGLLDIYQRIELPLTKVLAAMELNGIKVDQAWLAGLAGEWQTKLAELTQKIYQQAGQDFNINSPKQLQVVLFDDLKLVSKGLSKTKSGPSTDAANLQKLQQQHPIIELIIEYRELSKLLNTYALSLPKLINRDDGRLHANFQQAITATGRLSASEPNLQNIPTKTEVGKKLRQAFIADPGCQLISFDYSQIELRIMASLANEQGMIADFVAGQDIHLATAAKINDIPLDQVSDQQRRAAKAVNFGLLYGQGPHGLAEATGLSYGAAKDFIDQYFVVYPRIAEYMNEAVDQARRLGFAATVWGRRRYLPDLDSPNQAIRRAAERMAINLPIQGTAADIMKAAMIAVDDWLADNFDQRQARLILQIHDEILIEAASEKVDKIIAAVPKLMTDVIDLAVSLAVSTKTGFNWAEL